MLSWRKTRIRQDVIARCDIEQFRILILHIYFLCRAAVSNFGSGFFCKPDSNRFSSAMARPGFRPCVNEINKLFNCEMNAWMANGFYLWAGLCAIHDGVTAIHAERIFEFIQTFDRQIVTWIDDPAIGLHQNGRSQIFVRIPPVRWTWCRTACTQYAFIQSIQLGTIIHIL